MDKEKMKRLLTPYKTKPKFYVSKVTGKKYPYYHPNWSIHPPGTVMYCNFGSGDRGNVKDLPLDEYPYEMEYEEPKLPKWWRE